MVFVALTPFEPPSFLRAAANDSIKKITLNWNSSPGMPGVTGYRIERKFGPPESTNSFDSIATTNQFVFAYEDFDVELNEIYTYRIRALSGSYWSYIRSNEATAYVPAIVPVELLSFSSSVVDDDVTLNWTTATETNNHGFQVERRKTQNRKK